MSDYVIMICFQVLAAVIKAGAAREHEILAEIRDAVFSFIRKMEPRKVMDTMLVSRVRILYIRSLLARSPELQSIKVQCRCLAFIYYIILSQEAPSFCTKWVRVFVHLFLLQGFSN